MNWFTAILVTIIGFVVLACGGTVLLAWLINRSPSCKEREDQRLTLDEVQELCDYIRKKKNEQQDSGE